MAAPSFSTASVLQGTSTDTTKSIIPPGVVWDYAGTSAPDGWLLCYGQAISRFTTYAALFAAIGTTYGVGDGTTTFNLPDKRGRASAGKDDMGGSAAARLAAVFDGAILGNTGGSDSHILSIAEIPSALVTTVSSLTSAISTTPGSNSAQGVNEAPIGTTPTTNNAAGGAHANTQPTIIFNSIIKI